MLRPLRTKKIFGFLLFLVLFFLSVTLSARAEEKIILNAIDKEETPDFTRLVFSLSSVPEYRTEESGQRVDLWLTNVEPTTEFKTLPEGEHVVKMTLAKKYREQLLSILFRRPPRRVLTEVRQQPAAIIMTLYWADGEGVRPGIAFTIPDMPAKRAGKKATRFLRDSPWQGRWYDFFRDYLSPWEIKLPLHFTLPVLPPLIEDEQDPLWPLQQHAHQDNFLSLLQAAASMTGLSPEQLYRRDLLVAEAQLRTGSIEAALARLETLGRQEGGAMERVGYLTAYGAAVAGQPLVARIQLQELFNRTSGGQLMSYIRLLLAETALASHQDKAALAELRLQARWPELLATVATLRTADALAGSGEPVEALGLYHDLAEDSGLFEVYRFSAERAARTAFSQKDQQFSAGLYLRLLETMPEDDPAADMLLFAAGLTTWESGNQAWGRIRLRKATLEFPGTEGGDRSALRLLDLRVVVEGELGLAAVVPDYIRLGTESKVLSVREESCFKHGLALHLLAEHEKSIAVLMDFGRDFRRSTLRRDADALLVEQLPGVIHQLLEKKEDFKAVVLVEQNRKLLLSSGRFDQNFLNDLATAFEKLGLYERAARVLLYLLDQAEDSREQQNIYLPLARSYLKRGLYQQAGEYAERYLRDYPQGQDAAALFSLLLDSLEQQGRSKDVPDWVKRSQRPRGVALEQRVARIMARLEQWNEVIDSLEWIRNSGARLEVKDLALLAEACYQSGNLKAAEKNYRLLFADPDFSARAKYRTAQILLRRKQRESGIKLLNEVVAEAAETSWGKLAQDLLIQEQR